MRAEHALQTCYYEVVAPECQLLRNCGLSP
jgi:hypothetical protein